MRVDIHQHVWTEPFLAALARRREAPLVRRLGHGRWLLTLEGERPQPIDGDAPGARTRLLGDDGVDRGVVAPSSPLGVETLPPDQAGTLIEAYEEGLHTLPGQWRAWGTLPLHGAQPADVDGLLDRGLVGLCLPAGAVSSPAALERRGPLLERLEQRGAPLFVHPGPAAAVGAPGAPEWWPALTSYVAEMQAAWLAFVDRGRAQHPELRVLFAMLAGGAPLQLDRLRSRGGPVRRALDPGFFYDTSSYGWRALEAMAAWVGEDQLVYGSDRPVAAPQRRPLGRRQERAMRVDNPARLLGSAA